MYSKKAVQIKQQQRSPHNKSLSILLCERFIYHGLY